MGATFSPPAVMINSLILPVIYKNPFSSIFPKSPLWKNPYVSITSLVASSFPRYPIIMFLPLQQISPMPFSSGFYMFTSVPNRAHPAAFRLNLFWREMVAGPVVSLNP